MKTELIKTIILYSFYGLVLSGLLYLIVPGNFVYRFFMIVSSWGQLAGLLMFLIVSDIYKTAVFKVIVIGVVMYLLGFVFRILQLPYSGYLFLGGLTIILFFYFVRFFSKDRKVFLDFIKVIWLVLALTGSYFKINHLTYGDIIILSSSGILWVGLIYVLYDYKFKLMFEKR